MNWVFLKIVEKSNISSQNENDNNSFSIENKVSPSVLLVIIILSIIFFISGLLHLLVRFLLRPPNNRDPDDELLDSVTALQGQLQQLFHLHDAGVDQSFIDTLPVFHYNAIIGLKKPFDCAVCLCEFEPDDKLRLLPKCSHAFHMECIDTWLLSHSTCPLCRASLIPDFSSNNNSTNSNACSPIVLVLESGSESSREIANAGSRVDSNLRDELGSSTRINAIEVLSKGDKVLISNPGVNLSNGEKVVTVKLGKFRNMDVGEGSSSSVTNTSTIDERRCFSMGSFEYVMDENSRLQVPIRTPARKQSSKKVSNFPLTPGHKQAMSLCDCESRRFEVPFNGFDIQQNASILKKDRNEISGGKRESFSISKIWLRGKKDNEAGDSSRRAFSFRFPVLGNDEVKSKTFNGDGRRTLSEIGIARLGNQSSVLSYDEENQSVNSLDYSQAKTPSFARRTLLWLTGKQNKVLDHSSNPSIE
ncbi:hypothetical protein ACFE04_008121 [Oxalis oulophora]